MNQPKFKVGDKIKCTCGCNIRGTIIYIDSLEYLIFMNTHEYRIEFQQAEKLTKLEQIL